MIRVERWSIVVMDASVDSDRERAQSFVVFRLGGEGLCARSDAGSGSSGHAIADGSAWRPEVSAGGDQPARACRAGLRFATALRPEQGNEDQPGAVCADRRVDVANDPQITGLLVDRVSDVLEFSPEDVQAAPQLGLGKATPFVRGLIRHQDAFLLVLDVDRIFSTLGSLNGEGV